MLVTGMGGFLQEAPFQFWRNRCASPAQPYLLLPPDPLPQILPHQQPLSVRTLLGAPLPVTSVPHPPGILPPLSTRSQRLLCVLHAPQSVPSPLNTSAFTAFPPPFLSPRPLFPGGRKVFMPRDNAAPSAGFGSISWVYAFNNWDMYPSFTKSVKVADGGGGGLDGGVGSTGGGRWWGEGEMRTNWAVHVWGAGRVREEGGSWAGRRRRGGVSSACPPGALFGGYWTNRPPLPPCPLSLPTQATTFEHIILQVWLVYHEPPCRKSNEVAPTRPCAACGVRV
jgi:hypothetical protein